MSLPPLPKELAAFAETQARHCALNDMVQAYAQQVRAQALEEAATWLDFYDGQGLRRAEHIRSLK